jgi:hypothetical protein
MEGLKTQQLFTQMIITAGQVIDEWVVVVVPASPQIGQYEGGQRRAGGVDCCGGSRSKVVRAVTSYERSVPDKEEGEGTN